MIRLCVSGSSGSGSALRAGRLRPPQRPTSGIRESVRPRRAPGGGINAEAGSIESEWWQPSAGGGVDYRRRLKPGGDELRASRSDARPARMRDQRVLPNSSGPGPAPRCKELTPPGWRDVLNDVYARASESLAAPCGYPATVKRTNDPAISGISATSFMARHADERIGRLAERALPARAGRPVPASWGL